MGVSAEIVPGSSLRGNDPHELEAQPWRNMTLEVTKVSQLTRMVDQGRLGVDYRHCHERKDSLQYVEGEIASAVSQGEHSEVDRGLR